MTIATASEVKNNFGKFLDAVQNGEDVIILKNGKAVARMISNEKSISFLSDSLAGVLKGRYDDKNMRAERISKYENPD